MSGHAELYIDQGTTFNNIINLTDDVNNTYVNVSGYVVTSKMRRSYYSANSSGEFICTVTDAANGEITMSMSAANTTNLIPGQHVFDVKVVTGNTTSRILEGIVIVTPQATR